ncbi:hypothetical protein BCV69DRAFT_45532 [Microstroma glucosiphilum]|uniref:Uncharacterized protein n=1 Tax=Pseudomicrostroma glucosiphilum TaxID=1684307 RepID=A0A316U3T5_9BASI|nr:hypothetical protein BCV69DRAFT_45532 [Pseudomicrostroma glucosiphilum]PWN19141.1 hypothetical protein BCV69DRAFT_45532 [Pseudomicrostroma glucosiphilum]
MHDRSEDASATTSDPITLGRKGDRTTRRRGEKHGWQAPPTRLALSGLIRVAPLLTISMIRLWTTPSLPFFTTISIVVKATTLDRIPHRRSRSFRDRSLFLRLLPLLLAPSLATLGQACQLPSSFLDLFSISLLSSPPLLSASLPRLLRLF